MRTTPGSVDTQPRWIGAVVGCVVLAAAAHAGGGQPTVLAWNNLGMHCMDDDYSIFSILPPYNTLNAQVIDASGHLVTKAGRFTVTFDPIADPTGSINTTSIGKTNFWSFAPALFNATLAQNQGLAGFPLPGASGTPTALAFGAAMTWYEATGIPLTPWDDAGSYRPYPIVRVVATDTSSGVRAETVAVLPVSEEMDCRQCHGSDAGAAARPAAGWVNDPVPKRDYRLNILRLHDELNLGKPLSVQALAAAGLSAQGLYDQVVRVGHPVLCAACHASEALAAGGVAGVPSLTQAVHRRHAAVLAPDTGLSLDAAVNRSACYQCHPGSATRCLRGAMGSAVATDGSAALQCQSCHGSMLHLGAAGRTGWLDEPNCQSCHTGTATSNNGSIRFLSSLNPDGTLRQPVNATFATNANTPAAGKSLYRFSRGHGGVACAACHGSTHAEYPSLHPNDNLASLAAQGHLGAISTCTACHATMPDTVNGGPHGLHPVGQSWVSGHGAVAEGGDCGACHSADYRGTVLSRAMGDRQFSTEWGTRSFWRGQQVSCYECHDGAQSDAATSFATPTVPATLNLGATPRTLAVSATVAVSPASGATLRVVHQAEHGSVAVSGLRLTYQPDFGYVGPDTFSFAANNGVRESNLGVATVNVDLGDPAASLAGDGISNQLKYVLGLDPTIVVVTGLPVVQAEQFGTQRFLTLTALRNPLAADIPVRVEASGDGIIWVPLSDPALVLNNQPWLLKMRDSAALIAGVTRQLRLASGPVSGPTPTIAAGHLINLSTRALVRAGDEIAIAGFVLSGSGTKRLLIRAVGPRLADFGVTAPLGDPVMQLVRANPDGSSTLLLTSDNWAAESNAIQVVAASTRVGAFPLASPSGTNDVRSAACLVDLAPGIYSALVSSADTTVGIALVEIYDADETSAPTAKLVNLSTRGYVAEGNSIMIGGFVVAGTQAHTYLVRGIGPGLIARGVAGTLADPRLNLYRMVGTNNELLVSNDNWSQQAGSAAVATMADTVGAFPLGAGSKDAALLVTLAPGIYSVQLSGLSGTAGVAMVEIYEAP